MIQNMSCMAFNIKPYGLSAALLHQKLGLMQLTKYRAQKNVGQPKMYINYAVFSQIGGKIFVIIFPFEVCSILYFVYILLYGCYLLYEV